MGYYNKSTGKTCLLTNDFVKKLKIEEDVYNEVEFKTKDLIEELQENDISVIGEIISKLIPTFIELYDDDLDDESVKYNIEVLKLAKKIINSMKNDCY